MRMRSECDGFAKCECECDENAKALRILNANAKRMRRIFSHSHFSANRKMRICENANATFFYKKMINSEVKNCGEKLKKWFWTSKWSDAVNSVPAKIVACFQMTMHRFRHWLKFAVRAFYVVAWEFKNSHFIQCFDDFRKISSYLFEHAAETEEKNLLKWQM